MSRRQREYRSAIAAAATIGLVVAFVIWSSGAGGDGSSGDIHSFLAADESAFDSPSLNEPTDYSEPTESTAASTTPKSGPVARPLRDVRKVGDSPDVTADPAPRQAALTQPDGEAADSDNRAGVTSWNSSGPASSPSGRPAAAGTGAPSAAGGSSPGAGPASGKAKTASALAKSGEEQPLSAPQSVSRQGLADSAAAEDSTQAPRASVARTDAHASTLPGNTSTSTPSETSTTSTPTVPGDVSWPAPDLTSLVFDAPDSTLSESLLLDADPGNLLLTDAAGPASMDVASPVENPVVNPEPTSLLLLGTGLGLLARRLKRRERGAA